MLIYIRGVVYDSSKEDVGILLTDSDKKNIANMAKECNCYISGPKLVEEKADRIGTKLKQRSKKKCKS